MLGTRHHPRGAPAKKVETGPNVRRQHTSPDGGVVFKNWPLAFKNCLHYEEKEKLRGCPRVNEISEKRQLNLASDP